MDEKGYHSYKNAQRRAEAEDTVTGYNVVARQTKNGFNINYELVFDDSGWNDQEQYTIAKKLVSKHISKRQKTEEKRKAKRRQILVELYCYGKKDI